MVDFDDLETPVAALKTAPVATKTLYVENCKKCNGVGKVTIGYNYPRSVTCFSCDGLGKHEFKTSPEYRTKAKASAQKRKEAAQDALAAQVAVWVEQNPAEAAWIDSEAPRFEFARAMQESLNKYGSLTEKQMATVQRLTAQSAERKAQWAAEKAAAADVAPAVTVEKIEQAFTSAKEKGIKYPRLRLDSFVFTAAPAAGKNAGALYVKEGEEYLGKILGGKFLKVRSCDAETESRVVAAASDPEAAAVAYGNRVGACSCCGKTLSNKASIDRGIGPICADKYGW